MFILKLNDCRKDKKKFGDITALSGSGF